MSNQNNCLRNKNKQYIFCQLYLSLLSFLSNFEKFVIVLNISSLHRKL